MMHVHAHHDLTMANNDATTIIITKALEGERTTGLLDVMSIYKVHHLYHYSYLLNEYSK